MIKVSEILERVTKAFNDIDYARVDKATYIKFISDALNQVLLIRPDANAATVVVDLTQGVKQNIPDDGFRLIDVLFNVAPDGTYSSAITNVPKNSLDVIAANWPMTNNASKVSNFAHDPTNPKVYWVTPGVATGTKIAIVYSKAFPEVLTEEDVIDIDMIFKDPIISSVMIYLYMMDTESDLGMQKMSHYINLLSQSLGLEQQKGIDIGPREDK